MTPTEAAALLTICAAFDNRKPDADAAKAWALAMGDLRFEDCRDAVVEHYQTSREWIMPADVRTAVRRIRAKRIEDHPPLTPPPDLTPVQTVAWLKEQRRRIGDGETVDDQAAYGELRPRHLPDLRAPMPAPDDAVHDLDRRMTPPPPTGDPAPFTTPTPDPRAEARAATKETR